MGHMENKIDFSAFDLGLPKKVKPESAPAPDPERVEANDAIENPKRGAILDAHQVRSTAMIKTIAHHETIRMISDKNLETLLPYHFEPEAAYHCLSYGGVDLWSYLKHILKQQRIRYCLISSWIIAPYDADEICNQIEQGNIERIDFYVGDIFKGGYRGAYEKTLAAAKKCAGRVAIFHNHAKIIVGYGERFNFVIESSCNLNVNPRLEQTTIYTNTALADFYKDYFDSIHAFNRDFDSWEPWTPGGANND